MNCGDVKNGAKKREGRRAGEPLLLPFGERIQNVTRVLLGK